MIEFTGIAEPLPIAETFRGQQGVSLSDLARLFTLVTVVDAVNFMRDYMEALRLIISNGGSCFLPMRLAEPLIQTKKIVP